MAHDLETIGDKTSFFSVREKAWHKLGYVAEKYLPLDEVLKHSGLDYTVSLKPIYDADMQVIPDYYATTRSTDQKALGIVGSRYSPVQNCDLLEYTASVFGTDYRPQTDERGIETAGVLNGGREVFAVAKIDKALYVAGEEIDQYFVMRNSHDGSLPIQALVTPIRVVCRNTLNLALKGAKRSFSIRHTANYEDKISQGQRSLGLMRKYYETFAQFANQLVSQKFSDYQFDRLAESLYPINPDTTKREENNVRELRSQLVRCYNTQDLNNIRGTGWAAYNAVADQNDHYGKFKNDAKNPNREVEKIFKRSFEETSLKDHALSLILAAA